MSNLQFLRMPQVRAALGFSENRSVLAACAKHAIPVVTFNSRNKGLRASDLDLLLSRASGITEPA